MAFWLFVALNAVLLIRPEELLPDIAGLRLYLITICFCLIAAAPRLIETLQWDRLVERPITLCVLGFWLSGILSQLTRDRVDAAIEFGADFGKVILYYLLLISVIDTPARLRAFFGCLVGFVIVFSAVALLHFHGVIEVSTIKVLERNDYFDGSGEQVVVQQLQSTGLYNDPNDLCLILVTGCICALACAATTTTIVARLFWLMPVGLFCYAITLTRSRGGLLGLLVAVLTWAWGRYGWKKTLPVALVLIPAVPLIIGGRQGSISLGRQDTAHSRVVLWSDGLSSMMQNPLTGIGVNEYANEVGQVAHNSFVHAYVELGVVGGGIFLTLFVLTAAGLWRIRTGSAPLAGLRLYVLGVLVGYAGGNFSLSRNYAVPTYLVIGLADAYLRMAVPYPGSAARVGGWHLVRLAGLGLAGWLIIRAITQVLFSLGA